mmetsp:Transcript_40863/g.115584  ORF Transcript_40863/g.115584 Transcript_40863/m.115584 type:complete len:266 (-) Transcript_40863:269-1066(-)
MIALGWHRPRTKKEAGVDTCTRPRRASSRCTGRRIRMPCAPSVPPDLAEADDGADHAEDVECEVGEDAEEEVLEAVVAVRVHLGDRVLHPIEEDRMRRLDVVGRLRLLHRKPEEWPLVVAHEPQAGARVRVVKLAAAEVGGDAAAAVHAHGPEVVRRELLLAVDDGRDAIQVQVLEPHRLPHVEAGAVREVHAPGVHELLALLAGGVHRRVGVQVLDVVVGLHVEPEVHVAEHGRGDGRDQQRQRRERVPHLVHLALPRAHREEA